MVSRWLSSKWRQIRGTSFFPFAMERIRIKGWAVGDLTEKLVHDRVRSILHYLPWNDWLHNF